MFQKRFEKGYKQYGKNFFKIRRELLSDKETVRCWSVAFFLSSYQGIRIHFAALISTKWVPTPWMKTEIWSRLNGIGMEKTSCWCGKNSKVDVLGDKKTCWNCQISTGFSPLESVWAAQLVLLCVNLPKCNFSFPRIKLIVGFFSSRFFLLYSTPHISQSRAYLSCSGTLIAHEKTSKFPTEFS